MDKKRFDHIEQQMKTAADGWEPAFDEKAWERMEQMLGKEDDRKRPFAWWMWLLPLLLITGTAAYFIFFHNKPQRSAEIAAANTPATNDRPRQAHGAVLPQPSATHTQPTGMVPLSDAPSPASTVVNNASAKPAPTIPFTPVKGNDNNVNDGGKPIYDQQGKMRMTVSGGTATGDEDGKADPEEPAIPQPASPVEDTKPSASSIPEKKEALAKPVNKKEATNTTVSVPVKNKKEKQRRPSRFYFSLAGGMEANGVDFPGLNKVSPRAGLLTGYQLTPKWSIQTGFFSGSKKYVAGKEDYKAKAGSYWSTVDITKVDANCRVFEIPLMIRYDVSPGKKWNAFAGAGISSYIMDKEDYAYDYMHYGNPYHAEASYTGNRHLFSVLRLNGGIEKKISKEFSLGINPGLAIPLAGVGEGQIRLFATELLLNLKYRPFVRSKQATKK